MSYEVEFEDTIEFDEKDQDKNTLNNTFSKNKK